MNYRSDNPFTDWPETMAVTYRSEAFAEDLDDDFPTTPNVGWHPLERLVAIVPLLCIFAPVADAYLRF
ncbi:hypothetical protein [Roseateles asaccharophilus]|uniref:Uncharacterized protein n=1 Tax=Roseateles asaccharophilus TaxID=582607 RepID=A0ABU2A741_9BURK|nr:hypothetical protein [Roseateles asaccharophilus]MDR7333017.1 hypothetical protein [Roseateles asaccharophilus]